MNEDLISSPEPFSASAKALTIGSAPQRSMSATGTRSRTPGLYTQAQTVYIRLSIEMTRLGISKARLSRELGEFIAFDSFQSTLERLGLQLPEQFSLLLYKENGSSPWGGVLRVQLFIDKIPSFTNREEAEQRLIEAQERLDKHTASQRRQSRKSTTAGDARGTFKQRPRSEERTIKIKTQRLPASFLQYSKKKKVEADHDLALTVEKCRKEFEYDCLHKMGEANEIAQSLGLATTYHAFKDQDIQCHVYDGDQFIEALSLENFLREWRRLKRQQNSTMNPVKQTGNETEAHPKVSKKERQEELKHLLAETKELASRLKDQLMVLEKNGISANVVPASGFSVTFF